jgi:hypothetical protein
VIAKFWEIYLGAVNGNHPIKLSVVDVAEMMSLLKKVRFMFGDKTNEENFVDDIGYVSIAGMFAGIKPIQARAEPEPEPIKISVAALPSTNRIDLERVGKATRVHNE